MSKLLLHGRPWVVFDPQNKDHRRWFAEFNENRSWKNCPVRFVIDNDHGDLITMIQRSLIQYYVNKEFGKKKNNIVKLDTKSKKSYNKHIAKH